MLDKRAKRFTSEVDADRRRAGWGEWHWIIDTYADEAHKRQELIPAFAVARRLAELNGD